jgi:CDP-glucose 4,6-dehydratase
MEIDPAFWRGRKVFVTGHTGFKGGWLCLWLEQLGAEVAGFALPPDTKPNFFSAARVASAMRSTLGDIRDLGGLGRALRHHAPEIVIHMAAQALVRRSYEQPLDTFSTNVMGTANVLEVARSCSAVRAAIVITTDKCYENLELKRGYQEGDRLGGRDPYSASKACAELVTHAWRRSFLDGKRSLALASARAGNVIGGGDWAADRLIPDMVRAFADNAPADIRNPASTRPWQHVLDPLAGYLLLAQRLVEDKRAFAGPWNFGPQARDAKTVRWIADRACRLWGAGARWKTPRRVRQPHEARMLSLNPAKARRTLGWRPQLATQAALEWTIAWYRAYYRDPASARRLTSEQIARYQGQHARD